MKKINKIFYYNKWQKSLSNKHYSRKSPNKKHLFFYPECNQKDILHVILSSKKGLELNRALNILERKKYIYKIYQEIKRNYKLIAKLEAIETGKKILDAEKEILHSANIWRYASVSLKSLNSKKNLSKKHGGTINYEPVGVVSLIIPWNFPFVVLSERLPFIIAAGNSVIIKPSEFASKSIFYLMKIVKKIKFPNGAINLITGSGPKVGSNITKNKDVNMISFTGSTKVGKKIMANASKSIKRLSLELGGKNSILVFEDADIKRTINIIIDSFIGNAGQSCVSTSRLLVSIRIKDKLINDLLQKLRSIKDFKKIYGPISTVNQYNLIKDIIKSNKKYDKNIIFGSTDFKDKSFVLPIVYKDLPEKNIVNKKEIFGPVLSINSFKTTEEAIDISNSTDYGLSAIVCSKNMTKSMKIAERLKSGRIWINESVKTNYPSLPIGGYKESGLNRESGIEGLKTYSEIKSIIYNKEV